MLRTLLRDGDSKIRWHAAKAIVSMRIELGKLDLRALAHAASGPTEFDKAKLAVELLEGSSDEEFTRLATMEYERQAQLAAGVKEASPTNAA